MAEAVIMPKTGMAMEEGTIIEWLLKEGDKVSPGDPLVEIETDKSTMEVESDWEGTLLRILHPAGSTIPVVRPIAWIGEEGEEIPEETEVPASAQEESPAPPAKAAAPDGRSPSPPGKVKATPAARRLAAERGLDLTALSPGGSKGEIRAADVPEKDRTRATPLARRIAAREGLALEEVRGSGHGGKVFSKDLTAPTAPPSLREDRRIPLTKVQRITGRRMSESHREIPSVTMDRDADVGELLRLREEINRESGRKITINDFVLKAAALALRENPRLNSRLEGEELVSPGQINLNMAVATERGLLVPVIPRADELSLGELSLRAADLAVRGREGSLKPEEMEGGSFTVSNIGRFGVRSFTPIINMPQAAILGVCAIRSEAAFCEGALQEKKIMGLSLTFDHRIADGAEACRFFSRIGELLERPLGLLL